MKFILLSVATLLSTSLAAPEPPAVMDRETFYNLTLPEFTPSGDRIIDLRSREEMNSIEKRSECFPDGGIANGECVRYYSAGGCPDNNLVKGYKPTCNGNCYVDEFFSVKPSGDGTYSTNCELFSDTQCQNSLGSVGSKTGGGSCKSSGGWSMKCYYRC